MTGRLLVLRVDADRLIGYGHLTRCLALAEALVELVDVHPVFLTRSDIDTSPWRQQRISPGLAPDREIEALGSFVLPIAGVITDLCSPSEAQIRLLRLGKWPLVCIDDDTPMEFDCDLLVRPRLARAKSTFAAKTLDGPETILLRREFENLPRHDLKARVEHLLVCFGGSDPADMTGRVSNVLEDVLPAGVQVVSIVLGPGYPTPRSAFDRDGRFRLLRNVQNMAALMRDADLAVLSSGTLLYEAAAAGLPSLLVSLNRSQACEAEVAASLAIAVFLGHHQAITPTLLERAVADLTSAERRGALSRNGQALIDGGGRRRVARHIASLLEMSS